MTRTLIDISGDLRRLAPGRSDGERALRDLAATLDRPGRSNLADVDLARTYPPAIMLAHGGPWLRRLANGLELTRDVLIFIPVIYTWWKISQALAAYGTYSGNAPFLLAWQQGFDHRAEPLSTSAVVVAGVVLAVILLTMIAHVVRGWYEQQVHKRQQKLAVLLGEASLLLTRAPSAAAHDVSRADLTAIAAEITASSRSLQEVLTKSSRDIVAAVNAGPGSKLHEMFEKWIAAATELRDFGARLEGTQETVGQLRDTQAALSRLAVQIGQAADRLLAALAVERDRSSHAVHAQGALAASLAQSAELLSKSMDGLNERAEQFNELVLRMVYVVDRLDGMPGGGYR